MKPVNFTKRSKDLRLEFECSDATDEVTRCISKFRSLVENCMGDGVISSLWESNRNKLHLMLYLKHL
jgi:hypothetical protein